METILEFIYLVRLMFFGTTVFLEFAQMLVSYKDFNNPQK